MDDHQRLALRVLARIGVDLVGYADAVGAAPTLVVLGFGAGITMAACDHLRYVYPDAGILAADLPGSLGFERRVQALDYAGTAFPTLWLLWASLRPADAYAAALHERGFHARRGTWVYVGGSEGKNCWAGLGCQLVEELWGYEPMGNSNRWTSSVAGVAR